MNETALFDTPLSRAREAAVAANTKAREFIALTQESVDLAIELPSTSRTIWEGLRRSGQQGQVEAEQAARGAFLHYLEQCCSIVREAQLQAEHAVVLGGKPLPRADQLLSVLSDLESLRREALVGWPYPLPAALAGTSLAPVWMDEHSDIYVGRSRVPLETVVEEFKAGSSPEQIAKGYDTLQPADVYEAISYYLRYRDAVDAYLGRREAEAEELREQIEAAQAPKAELKARVKERWSRKAANASPAE